MGHERMTETRLRALAKVGIYCYEVHWEISSQYKRGFLTCITEEDSYGLLHFLQNEMESLFGEYQITIYHKRPSGGPFDWVFSVDSTKMRVANPNHRIFIVIGGRDCDGMNWCSYLSFEHIDEAADAVNETLSYADGPTIYHSLSVEEYEMGGFSEYRDRFAESMGY